MVIIMDENSDRGDETVKKEIKEEVKTTEARFNFAKRKENTIRSLFEIEKFLCSSTKVLKGVKIFNILKH